MSSKNKESKVIFSVVSLIFLVFLLIPRIIILLKSFESDNGIIINYKNILLSDTFKQSLTNSVLDYVHSFYIGL